MTNFSKNSPLILIADDDRSTRILLRFILQQQGYQVMEVENGLDCLNAYQENQPDMVLLDAMMPGIDGFSCCRQIKNLPFGDITPILMITSLENRSSIDKAFAAGATDYIHKPIQPEVLSHRLRHLLEASWAQAALIESEKQYRSLVDNLKEVIFQTDLEGRLVFLNPAWTQMTGFSTYECIGRSFWDFVHPEESQIFQQKCQDLLSGEEREEVGTRIRYLTEDNRYGWCEIYVYPMWKDDEYITGIGGTINDITERWQREQYEKIEREVHKILAEAVNLDEAGFKIIYEICQFMTWDVGQFWLLETQASLWSPIAIYSNSSSLESLQANTQELFFKHQETSVDSIWQSLEPIWLEELLAQDANSPFSFAAECNFKTVFGVPIFSGNERLAVMLFFSLEHRAWQGDLVKNIVSMSNQIGQFIKRKQAEQEVLRRNLLLRSELNQAGQYVLSLLPTPLIETVKVEQLFIPSAQLGGDVFDYYWLDRDHLVIYLLDVAGHGVRSALLSVSVLNLLRTQSLYNTNFYEPWTVLAELNRLFQMNEEGENYFTIWYGVYNRLDRELYYACAGHPPALLISGATPTNQLIQLSTESIPVGLISNFEFEQDCCAIEPNSSLYLYSDGVYEITQTDGQMWGLDPFISLVESTHKQPLSNLEQILEQIKLINSEQSFADDFSILKISF